MRELLAAEEIDAKFDVCCPRVQSNADSSTATEKFGTSRAQVGTLQTVGRRGCAARRLRWRRQPFRVESDQDDTQVTVFNLKEMSNARDVVGIAVKFHPATFRSRGRSKLASSYAFYSSYAFHYLPPRCLHKMFDDHSTLQLSSKVHQMIPGEPSLS
jgi:hypothetical protein